MVVDIMCVDLIGVFIMINDLIEMNVVGSLNLNFVFYIGF